MKYLTRGATSTFVCTLYEKQTLTNPYWLFRFVNDASKVDAVAILTDVSSYPTRYNKFQITEGGSLVLPKGIYTYYIYEQTSDTNTNYLLSTTLCETGQAEVESTTSQQQASFPSFTIERSWTTQ